MGRPDVDVVGTKLSEVLDNPAALSAGWEHVLSGHRLALEVCLTVPSGDTRYGLLDVNRFQDREGFRVVVSIQDQTAARHAVADLQRYYSMVAYSMDAIISLDPSGNVATWNAGAQNLYGYTADEILGHPLTMLAAGESASFLTGLAGRVMDGEVVEGEVQQRCRNGSELWVCTQASPIYHRVEGIQWGPAHRARRDPSPGDGGGASGGEDQGGAGRGGQEPVLGQCEPRDPDADERHFGHDRSAAGHLADRRPAAVRGAGQDQRHHAARADQRHFGLFKDRGPDTWIWSPFRSTWPRHSMVCWT